MKIQKQGSGLRLPDYRMSMDCSGKEEDHLIVSHAHGDHMPRSPAAEKVFTTSPTARFMKLRGGPDQVTSLEFYESVDLDHVTITLYPAGHILGSAMIYVESDEGNLLFTGDYRTPAAAATEGFDCPTDVDILVTEATFGLPIYRWPSHEQLFDQIRCFARKALDEGNTPFFLAYNLGKAQELMHILAPLKETVQIHGAGYKLCPVYEEFNVDLGVYEPYERDSAKGKILIAPSSAHSTQFASHIKNKRIAYCSGWAILESRRTQLTVDELIPLSDHLDFFELICLCEQLQPKQVLITHTPDSSVIQHYLSQRNIPAQPLEQVEESYE